MQPSARWRSLHPLWPRSRGQVRGRRSTFGLGPPAWSVDEKPRRCSVRVTPARSDTRRAGVGAAPTRARTASASRVWAMILEWSLTSGIADNVLSSTRR
jgi:hypothetical protein